MSVNGTLCQDDWAKGIDTSEELCGRVSLPSFILQQPARAEGLALEKCNMTGPAASDIASFEKLLSLYASYIEAT